MTGSALAPSAWQTVLLGVTIYVAGQIIQRFFMDPIQQQRQILGEIASARLLYANIQDAAHRQGMGGFGPEYLDEAADASRALRLLASRLHSTLKAIPWYSAWTLVRVVPSRTAVRAATVGLIGWSNSLFSGDPRVHREMLIAALQLPEED